MKCPECCKYLIDGRCLTSDCPEKVRQEKMLADNKSWAQRTMHEREKKNMLPGSPVKQAG